MVRIQPDYVLDELRERMAAQLTPNTARRYLQELRGFFREEELEDPSEITPEMVIGAMAGRTKNACTALHRGLLHLQELDPSVQLPAPEQIEEIRSAKRRRSVRPAKTLHLDETLQKINKLHNKKLKYALRLMLASGLRVFEVAALQPDDVSVTPDGRLRLTVRHGKGDRHDVVTCMEDVYLEKQLPAYLRKLKAGESPFYSAETMKKYAHKLGIECHDLRRIAAQVYRNERLEARNAEALEPESVAEIDDETRLFLRHERFSTTKRYLYNHRLKIHLPEDQSQQGGDSNG